MVKVYHSLYDRMLSIDRLRKGFHKAKKAKGGPGVDGQTLADFAADLEENLAALARELRTKSYCPLPVLRKEVPKGNGKMRKLGVPAVRDRVVQQALLVILQPIFDPGFHPSSYGYRPGRSCHQAISKATLFIRRYEMQWVVDMDLSKCFDTLDHGIILASFRRRIADGSILGLLRMFLSSGVMVGDQLEPSDVGSPQGGVISPLIANVYLDAFDQFMKARGHRIVRYADDILIFTRSKSAATNALEQATRYLEKTLLLAVNQEKTHVVHSGNGAKFLGVVIRTNNTSIRPDKVRDLKVKVKGITRRNSPVNLAKVIDDLNPVVRGFANYYRIANCKELFGNLSQWIRRRLRAKQMALWKKPKKLHRRLRQLGYRGEFDAIKMSSWHNAKSPLSHRAMQNAWFDELGLHDMAGVQTGITVSDC